MAEGGGMNKGWAVAVIGILIIIAVLAIKFSSGSPTDEFMGITNPDTTYGRYFQASMGIGVIMMIIGGLMGSKTEKTGEEEGMTRKEGYGKDEYVCECLDCGHIMETYEHCREIECPECGGGMRRSERPGMGR
ncbi:MAG: hypothetical protein V5A88_10200 [Candidatus Thermoplasmatota archaeon]